MCRSWYRLNPMNKVSDNMNAFQYFYLNIEVVETCKKKTVNLSDFRSRGINVCGSRGGLEDYIFAKISYHKASIIKYDVKLITRI